MKNAFVLLAFLFPIISFADYTPDRLRPTAEGEMEAITGDGKFENVGSVWLVELSTDGKGITHYELFIGDDVYNFSVSKSSTGNCGDTYEAAEDANTKLILKDMSFAECEFRSKHKWEAQVVNTEGDRASHLFIGGDPEHLLISQ